MQSSDQTSAAQLVAQDGQRAELERLRAQNAELREVLEVRTRDLARIESTLGCMFEAFPVEIVLIDEHGAIVRRNRAWANQEARLSEQVGEGRPYAELVEALFGASEARKVHAGLERLMRREISELIQEVELAGGPRKRWIVVRAARLSCPQEERLIVIHDDVTDQHRADEALRRLPSIEAASQLAGGIAQNFNDLLTSIQYHATFALDALDPAGPAAEEIRQIEGAAARASELTSRLLAFSRQQTAIHGVLDLNEVVLDALPTLRRLGGRLTIETRLADGVGNIVGDQAQVGHVLANLVLNARDACAPAGRVIIRTERAQGHVRLVVEDDGCGIAEDVVQRIFEPFFTSKSAGKASGLGLAVVDAIVQRMGGRIRVRSRPSAGAEFHIELPTASGVAPTRPHSRRPLGAAEEGQTILLVEDDDTLRRVTARALTARRYHVLSEADAASALKILEDPTIPLALLVSDVVMPAMSGTELAVRARALRPTLPILLVTGYAPDPPETPAHPTLRKPFTPIQLQQSVRAAIGARPNVEGLDVAQRKS